MCVIHEVLYILPAQSKDSKSRRHLLNNGVLSVCYHASGSKARRCPADARTLEDWRKYKVSQTQGCAIVYWCREKDDGGVLGKVVPWVPPLPTGER